MEEPFRVLYGKYSNTFLGSTGKTKTAIKRLSFSAVDPTGISPSAKFLSSQKFAWAPAHLFFLLKKFGSAVRVLT
jgi:hypothetical protein